ncbi:hypothetical protein [Cellulomonas fimi]|uniref:Uncharacterized protein n=1 Tax=Cellulomonas fimi TaxID=1708 RepID=A0A7Y0M258_CELFI|nr:hypothetical protein [Cellulomonas fimi]NMR21067.1 hypothetical protein [Cellulomonas fimi]
MTRWHDPTPALRSTPWRSALSTVATVVVAIVAVALYGAGAHGLLWAVMGVYVAVLYVVAGEMETRDILRAASQEPSPDDQRAPTPH